MTDDTGLLCAIGWSVIAPPNDTPSQCRVEFSLHAPEGFQASDEYEGAEGNQVDNTSQLRDRIFKQHAPIGFGELIKWIDKGKLLHNGGHAPDIIENRRHEHKYGQ